MLIFRFFVWVGLCGVGGGGGGGGGGIYICTPMYIDNLVPLLYISLSLISL